MELFILMPFFEVGETFVKKTIESANLLAANYENSISIYTRSIMMLELKESNPFIADEKIKDVVLNEICDRLNACLHTRPLSEQKADKDKLSNALKL